MTRVQTRNRRRQSCFEPVIDAVERDKAAVARCRQRNADRVRFDRCFRLTTRTRSARSALAAPVLSALTIAVRSPSRDAAIAVITAPPPIVAVNVSVRSSSPFLGMCGNPIKIRSSNASPTVDRSRAARAESIIRDDDRQPRRRGSDPLFRRIPGVRVRRRVADAVGGAGPAAGGKRPPGRGSASSSSRPPQAPCTPPPTRTMSTAACWRS